MTLYRYFGRDKMGLAKNGEIEAGSDSEVAAKLLEQDIIPIKIVIKTNYQGFLKNIRLFMASIFTIDRRDFRLFSLKMSILLKVGVPIRQAVTDLAESTASPILRMVLNTVERRLNAGLDLVQSFSGFPTIFSPLHIAFLKQSANNGRAYQVFDQLAETINMKHKLQKELLSPLFPYVFTLLVIAVVCTVISNMALPIFMQAKSRANGQLPPMTELLISIIASFQNWRMWIVILIALIAGFMALRRNESVRLKMDQWFLKVPMAGYLARLIAIGEFLRAVRLSLENGMNIQDSIKIASVVLQNGYLKAKIDRAYQALQTGSPVFIALENSTLFTTIDLQMLKLGERSNDMLSSVNNIILLNDEIFEHQTAVAAESLRLFCLVVLSLMVILIAFGFYFGLWFISNSRMM
jgi:type II secretory pathway component PulF